MISPNGIDPMEQPQDVHVRMLLMLESHGCEIDEQVVDEWTTRWVITDEHGDEMASGCNEETVIERAFERLDTETQ